MMDQERVDKWCAKGVLGLVLAILIYTPLATGAVRPQDFVVVEWLTVALLAVWSVRFLVNPKHRLLWAPVCWAILLFVIYAVGRSTQADIEFIARQEMIRVLVYAVLFYAILTNLHKQSATQFVAITLIVLAAGISMYAIAQFLTESNHVWGFVRPAGYAKRGSGTFISPNSLAGYLEMILPLGLAYTLTGRFEHVTKVILGYCSLMIFGGIAVTVSRGGWLATGLMLMVFFFWLIRQRGYRMQAVLLLVTLVIIGAVFFYKASLSKNRNDSLSVAVQMEDIRFKLWAPAMAMWHDHFWWGVGPAHFDYRFREYRPADDQLQIRPDRVHNDYLNTLVDWGLVGGVLVAAIWIIFYWEVFRSWKYVQRAPNDLTTKRSNKTSLVMGASLGLLAILFHSIVDFNMHIPANALVVVTLMALVTGHFRFATERYWITVHWPLRILVLLILWGTGGYLGWQAWQRTREVYWLEKAEASAVNPPAQIQDLERAFAVEPKNFNTAYQIGESYRRQSWEGHEDYRELAQQALPWYQRGTELNPYDPYNFLRYGMCLDWLGEHEKAASYFQSARKLDPNNYYILANVGWHYVQVAEAADGDPDEKRIEYQKAKTLFDQSLRLKWSTNNVIAHAYLRIASQKLQDLNRGRVNR